MIFVLIAVRSSKENTDNIKQIISPVQIVFQSGEKFLLKEFETFDSSYTEKNKKLSKSLSISEDEAFILGNFANWWAENILANRKVSITDNDIIYSKISYKTKFENSPFCLKYGKPTNKFAFEKQLNSIRKGTFVIVDLNTDNIYPISKENAGISKNFVIVRKSHVKTNIVSRNISAIEVFNKIPSKYTSAISIGNLKIIVSDSTSKLIPDRNCSSDICKEILKNINNTKDTLDIAIYGYSSTPQIETAIINAKNRGVKIRLVYDVDSSGKNIYPDTEKFIKLIPNNKNDKNSPEVGKTMHNKFYIFDNKVVITGSANLSHTDMSGYNSNSIIVINSADVAKIFKEEFEQMYNGKFHNEKIKKTKPQFDNLQIFFSPQDKGINTGILPIIKNAKRYIYIPSFVITDKNITEELVNAHKRGVDIKIIVDSLNASTKHSKHRTLRQAGLNVKAENYAGKMHSKTIIVDDEYLIIGSMNFSNSGENKNDENFVIVKNNEAAKFYRQFFLYQWSRIPDKWLNATPRAEGRDSIGSCSDGLDNNYDGQTDSEDEACKKI